MSAPIEIDSSTDLCIKMAKVFIDNIRPRTIARVSIDRFNGLTFFSKDKTPLFHATGLVCGYHGTGPSGSIEIWDYAGFGDQQQSVHTNESIDLSI